VPTLELGASLRDARIGRGLDVQAVVNATMIPWRVIEAFEAERFEQLPQRVYARSFLREYAAFLGLDPDVYAAAYDARVAPSEPEPPPPSVIAPRRRSHRGVLVAAALAVVAVAGVVAWQLAASGKTPRAATPPAAVHRHARAHHVAAQQPQRQPANLTLTAARGSCWLRVQSGARVVFERTLEQGRTVRFGLGQPLSIRLGAPWNVEAWIGRRSVTAALPQRIGDVVVGVDGVRSTT